jgi:hypothetical protein
MRDSRIKHADKPGRRGMGIFPGRLGVSNRLCRCSPPLGHATSTPRTALCVFRLLYRSDVKQGQRHTVTEACCTPTASRASRAFNRREGGPREIRGHGPGIAPKRFSPPPAPLERWRQGSPRRDCQKNHGRNFPKGPRCSSRSGH